MTKKNITITILLILVAIGIGIAIGIAKSKISIASAKEPQLVPFKELKVGVLSDTVALTTNATHLDKAQLNTLHDLLNPVKDEVALSTLKNNLKPAELSNNLKQAKVLDPSKELEGKTFVAVKHDQDQVKGGDLTKQVHDSKLPLTTKDADLAKLLDLGAKNPELKLTSLDQEKAADSVKEVERCKSKGAHQ